MKLKAQAKETKRQHNRRIRIGMMIIDVAPKLKEIITDNSLTKIKVFSSLYSIDLWYFSQDGQLEILH